MFTHREHRQARAAEFELDECVGAARVFRRRLNVASAGGDTRLLGGRRELDAGSIGNSPSNGGQTTDDPGVAHLRIIHRRVADRLEVQVEPTMLGFRHAVRVVTKPIRDRRAIALNECAEVDRHRPRRRRRLVRWLRGRAHACGDDSRERRSRAFAMRGGGIIDWRWISRDNLC